MTDERWLPLIGYEDNYLISNHGRVKSTYHKQDKILKLPLAGRKGNQYQTFQAYKNSLATRLYVHHVVLSSFVGPRPEGLVIRHLDGNRLNNKLTNLCYGTPEENQSDRLEHGTDHRGVKAYNAKLTEEKVLEIRRMANTGITHRRISEIMEIPRSTISNVVCGYSWSHV